MQVDTRRRPFLVSRGLWRGNFNYITRLITASCDLGERNITAGIASQEAFPTQSGFCLVNFLKPQIRWGFVIVKDIKVTCYVNYRKLACIHDEVLSTKDTFCNIV